MQYNIKHIGAYYKSEKLVSNSNPQQDLIIFPVYSKKHLFPPKPASVNHVLSENYHEAGEKSEFKGKYNTMGHDLPINFFSTATGFCSFSSCVSDMAYGGKIGVIKMVPLSPDSSRSLLCSNCKDGCSHVTFSTRKSLGSSMFFPPSSIFHGNASVMLLLNLIHSCPMLIGLPL